jgi:altronate dehydratase
MNVARTGTALSALVVHGRDDVAVLTADARAGDPIHLVGALSRGRLVATDAIATGHKVSLRAMRAGDTVRKYGEVIGRLTADIAAGQHVHVHNLVSLRAGERTRNTDDDRMPA